MSGAKKVESFERVCYDHSHQWFLKDDIDCSKLEGVSVGKIFQLWTFEKFFEASQVNADRLDVRSLLKRLSLEWTVRSLASIFSRNSDAEKTEYLLVYDVNNDPMINALNAIGEELRRRGVSISAVTVDRNISRKCSIPRQVSWFSFFSLTNFFVGIERYIKFYFGQVTNLKSCAFSLQQQFGKKKARSVRRYMTFQSLQLSFEIQAIRSLLMAKKPKVVILASDAHRVSRTFVFLCKLLRVKTVVYQHGATIWEYGYVPVFADRMLVWGNASRRWFQQRGVSVDKLVEVGNLQADMRPIPRLTPTVFQRNKKIFFFPNPIDRDITRDVLDVFIELCSRFSMEGVVKLHPSERNIDFFESHISSARNNVSVIQVSMAEAGVLPGDIAVVVNSTAGIDCCIYGAYIFNIEISSMPNPVDYERGGVGVRASLDSYVDKFDHLLELPVEDYICARDAFLRDYFGPLDGMALERIVGEILN